MPDIFITGAVDAATLDQVREELSMRGGANARVVINSEGGDVFSAIAIYSLLKDYQGKVYVRIDGLAASAASVIAMAGDFVEISPLGMIMIHNPWSCVQGDAQELEAAINMLKGCKESIVTAYELKTKLPRDQIAEMMDEETWLPAHEAIKLHFVDAVVDTGSSNRSTCYTRDRVISTAAAAIKSRLATSANEIDSVSQIYLETGFPFGLTRRGAIKGEIDELRNMKREIGDDPKRQQILDGMITDAEIFLAESE